MNKLLKSTLIAGGVMGAFFASEANAQSFNVQIDEIELVSDADNYLSTANTVYKPSVGMGATTTTTVDFFNTSSNTFSLTKPQVGTYEAMVIHFDTVAVSGTNVTLDLAAGAQYGSALFHSYGGRSAMVFGSVGTGGNSIDDVVTGGTATPTTGFVPMQPVVVTSTAFTIPEFNWNFPSANVQDSGATGVSITGSGMDPFTLARNVDSTLPNFMVDVDPSVFDGVTGFTSGTSNITVGLFTDSDLGPRPMFRTTFTPSNQAKNDAASRETITFYDVPSMNMVPVAWFDANNNKLLDQGEYVTMHSNTVAGAGETVAAADISFTVTDGILDTAAVAFGYREFSLTLPISDTGLLTSLNFANTGEFDGDFITIDPGAALNGTTAASTSTTTGTLNVDYHVFNDGVTQVERALTFDIAYGESENTGGTAGTLETADTDANIVLAAASSADSESGATYTAASRTLVISGIPFTAIDTVSANNVGEFEIRIEAVDTDSATTSATEWTINESTAGGTNENEDPVAGKLIVTGTDGGDTDGNMANIALGAL